MSTCIPVPDAHLESYNNSTLRFASGRSAFQSPVSKPIILLDVRRGVALLWVILKGSFRAAADAFRPMSAERGYPVHIRRALEELGFTYLKLGQFLAMRFDLLPPRVCEELNKLFETAPPMSIDQVTAVIEKELAGRVSTFFSDFHVKPLGSASVAQVHKATTHDGRQVAVKVQRPGIEQVFEADMRNLHRAARIVDFSGAWPTLSFQEVTEEFATYTRRELNFILEAKTAERLRATARSYQRVPTINWELTSSRVLTMEYLEGISVARAAAMLRDGDIAAVRSVVPDFNAKLWLHRFAFASLHQLFTEGFFHADPHPGNILISSGNTVSFIDFGIFGMVSPRKRETLFRYIENVAAGDIENAFRHYAKLSTPTTATDTEMFKLRSKAVLVRWHHASQNPAAPVQDRHLGNTVGQLLAVLQDEKMRMTMDTLLFWRAVIALDASALSISEHFDLLREMRDFFQRKQARTLRRRTEELLDFSAMVSRIHLLQEAHSDWRSISQDVRTGVAPWQAGINESRGRGRVNAKRTKALVGSAVGVSLAVLAAGAPVEAPARAFLLISALTLQYFSLRRL